MHRQCVHVCGHGYADCAQHTPVEPDRSAHLKLLHAASVALKLAQKSEFDLVQVVALVDVANLRQVGFLACRLRLPLAAARGAAAAHSSTSPPGARAAQPRGARVAAPCGEVQRGVTPCGLAGGVVFYRCHPGWGRVEPR